MILSMMDGCHVVEICSRPDCSQKENKIWKVLGTGLPMVENLSGICAIRSPQLHFDKDSNNTLYMYIVSYIVCNVIYDVYIIYVYLYILNPCTLIFQSFVCKLKGHSQFAILSLFFGVRKMQARKW